MRSHQEVEEKHTQKKRKKQKKICREKKKDICMQVKFEYYNESFNYLVTLE